MLLGWWCKEAIRFLCTAETQDPREPRREKEKSKPDGSNKENKPKNDGNATRGEKRFPRLRLHGYKGTQSSSPILLLSCPSCYCVPAPFGFRDCSLIPPRLPAGAADLRGAPKYRRRYWVTYGTGRTWGQRPGKESGWLGGLFSDEGRAGPCSQGERELEPFTGICRLSKRGGELSSPMREDMG